MTEILTKGSVVLMKKSSGLIGYGNYQCVSWVSHEIGELSLYGHNKNYKTYDVERVIEKPFAKEDLKKAFNAGSEISNYETSMNIEWTYLTFEDYFKTL